MRNFTSTDIASADGTILGAAASKPLRVNVSIYAPGVMVSAMAQPRTAQLSEALAQVATMYLTTSVTGVVNGHESLIEYFGLPASSQGQWQVTVNTQPIDDMTYRLKQGDLVFVNWQPLAS